MCFFLVPIPEKKVQGVKEFGGILKKRVQLDRAHLLEWYSLHGGFCSQRT